MQVNHQQSPLPGITQPLTKHTRAHAEDAEDQDGSHDDLATTPLESSTLPEFIQTTEEDLLHKRTTGLISGT